MLLETFGSEKIRKLFNKLLRKTYILQNSKITKETNITCITQNYPTYCPLFPFRKVVSEINLCKTVNPVYFNTIRLAMIKLSSSLWLIKRDVWERGREIHCDNSIAFITPACTVITPFFSSVECQFPFLMLIFSPHCCQLNTR